MSVAAKWRGPATCIQSKLQANSPPPPDLIAPGYSGACFCYHAPSPTHSHLARRPLQSLPFRPIVQRISNIYGLVKQHVVIDFRPAASQSRGCEIVRGDPTTGRRLQRYRYRENITKDDRCCDERCPWWLSPFRGSGERRQEKVRSEKGSTDTLSLLKHLLIRLVECRCSVGVGYCR